MYGTVRPDSNDILKHIIIWLLLTTQTFVYVKYGLGKKEVGESRHLLKTVKHDNIFFAMAPKDTEDMTLISIYWQPCVTEQVSVCFKFSIFHVAVA